MLGAQGLEHDGLVDTVHELGRELAASGFDGGAVDLVVQGGVDLHALWGEAEAAVDQVAHLGGPQVRGHDDDALREVDAAVVAEGQSGFVQNAEQQLPQGVGSFFDFVEQQDGELQLLGVPLIERFLRQQRMGLAVAEVSRRRADQLGDLVRVLELGAVDLDAGASVAEQGFRHGFDDAGLAGAGGPQKQEVADRTAGRIQAGQEHLVDLDHLFNGLLLADDFAAKGVFKLPGIIAAAGWVEHCVEDRFHRGLAPSFVGLCTCSWESGFRSFTSIGIDKLCHSHFSARPLVQMARHPLPNCPTPTFL